MGNSILLHGLNIVELESLIDSKLKFRLGQLKKDLINQSFSDDLLTRDEACAFLKINSSTLWTWTNKGKITAHGIGSRRYYLRSELLESIKIKSNS